MKFRAVFCFYIIIWYYFTFCVFGKNPAMMPRSGRKALTWKMNSTLVLSASHPKKAEPKPPKPNISPKKMPAISPTLSGIKSVA